MTWWRQSRDSFGKTIPQRLTFDILLLEEAIAARNIERDKEWISWARSHIKRIRSILRRLKRCVECHGTGKVPGLEERGGPWMEYQVLIEEECMDCGGKGTVSFDTKGGHTRCQHKLISEQR